jgi:uncharacterized membrane protein
MQRFGAFLVPTELSQTTRSRTRLGTFPSQRTWPALLVLTILLGGSLGCSSTKRKFDEVKHASDAGETHTKQQDAGASSGEWTNSSETETSSTSDGGGLCANQGSSTCPTDTECRKYEVNGCDEAGKPVCDAINVEANTPCADGAGQCDGKGECVHAELARLGEACEEDAECGSGHCVVGQDGARLCCDAACDGVCTACGTDGHCDVTPTEDAECGELTCPESNECTVYPPKGAACGSFGECAKAEAYCEPTYTKQSCGDGLLCDGRGNCCPEPGPERECTKECPCGTGEGLCSNNEQCLTGYVCTTDATTKLGFPGASCLPAHCVNDKQDEGEISVDCGAGCGCRATYELVEITGVPEDARFSELKAMSADGNTFAATIGRSSSSSPVRVSASGVVSELVAYGTLGAAAGISADGTVIVGTLHCGDPPECTTSAMRPFRWVNDGQPEVVGNLDGTAVSVSATGALVAGYRYDVAAEKQQAFRITTQPLTFITIPEMESATEMSADGQTIVGHSVDADVGLLWSATRGVVSLNVPIDWSRWEISALSSDGQVFSGFGYVATEGRHVPYVWRDGEFTPLPMLPGARANLIADVSGDGSVIVGLSDSDTVQRAFIWDQSKGIRSVVAEVTERGVELPVDLELVGADFVSDNGRIIVGTVHGDIPSFWRVTLLRDGEWLP